MLYVIKEDESIYDVAIKLYGDSVFAVKIVLENSDVINLASSNIAGIEITYDETLKEQLSRLLSVSKKIISDAKENYTVKEGQSIYDLAIMFGYGVENVIQFIQDIELANIDAIVTNLTISVTKIKTNLTDYIALQNKVLTTDTSLELQGILTDDGDPIHTDDDFWLAID